jgi:acetylornithine deacetylase/succinyl-diaminopimelate desuccinylase-like protein
LRSALDDRVAELAERYRPLAAAILAEAIRIPADEVDVPVDDGGNPLSGLSNHEVRRLRFLRDTIVDVGAVLHADDVGFDDFGKLVWTVTDPFDETAPEHKRVIYLDGHSDTVQALREQWHDKLGGAVDPYDGLVDASRLDAGALRAQLGYVPPADEWDHLVFGRGAADQLADVVAEIIASKILLELREDGALHGCVVRAYATAAEEDNDGGGPRYVMRHVLPGSSVDLVPDVVILTEGTGDSTKGALGIYRGQRGRMQIEMTVTGRSCHGSMPSQGLNPLEHGGAIPRRGRRPARPRRGHARPHRARAWHAHGLVGGARIAERLRRARAFHVPLGPPAHRRRDARGGAVADRVARRRGGGARCRADGRRHRAEVHAPDMAGPCRRQRGDLPGLDQARGASGDRRCRRCLSPCRDPVRRRARRRGHGGRPAARAAGRHMDLLHRRRRLPIDSTDVTIAVRHSKAWVVSGEVRHPAMFGIGAGIEQNTHRIGEHVDTRELQHAIAVLARFPQSFVAATASAPA